MIWRQKQVIIENYASLFKRKGRNLININESKDEDLRTLSS